MKNASRKAARVQPAAVPNEAQRMIARAIAAVRTAQNPTEQPFTEEEVLAEAFAEGMVYLEKQELGTASLDHSIRPGEPDYLDATPIMLGLLRAVRESKAVRS